MLRPAGEWTGLPICCSDGRRNGLVPEPRHCPAQEAQLPFEPPARDAPREVQLQQCPVDNAERPLFPYGHETGGMLARDEMAQRFPD